MTQKMANRYVRPGHHRTWVVLTHSKQEVLLAFMLPSAFKAALGDPLSAYQLASVRAGVIREFIMHPGHGMQDGGLTTSAVERTATTVQTEKSTCDNVKCIASCHMELEHEPKTLLKNKFRQLEYFTKMELTNN